MKEFVLGLDELGSIVEEIEGQLPQGGVVILEGDLAAGKTTLTQAFAHHLGQEEKVTSPTFSLQQCYGDKLFHYDFFNKVLENFMSLGLLEELEKEGYHLVEWGDDKLKSLLDSAGIPSMHIEIKKDNNKRVYRCIN